jgi:hypothetical protein
MSCAQSVPNSGALRSIPDNSGQFISRDSRLRSPPFPASTSSPSRGTSSSRWRGAPGPARACPPCAVELAEAEVAVSDEGRMPSSRRRPRFRDSAPHGYWRRPRRDGSRCRSRCSAAALRKRRGFPARRRNGPTSSVTLAPAEELATPAEQLAYHLLEARSWANTLGDWSANSVLLR